MSMDPGTPSSGSLSRPAIETAAASSPARRVCWTIYDVESGPGMRRERLGCGKAKKVCERESAWAGDSLSRYRCNPCQTQQRAWCIRGRLSKTHRFVARLALLGLESPTSSLLAIIAKVFVFDSRGGKGDDRDLLSLVRSTTDDR
jgi:hypothetical protein